MSVGKVDLEKQLWKKGIPDAEGYFTLKLSHTPKFMTAISSSTLQIKGNTPLKWKIPNCWLFTVFLFLYIDHLEESKNCKKNISTLPIRKLVTERSDRQDIRIAYFINVTFREYQFWILYAFTVFGIILVTIAESSEAFRDGYRYFISATNLLDIGNLFCAGICLICTLTQYKDSALWFGSTSVLFSWIINAKGIGDMPIVGNWVYLFGNTVKKVATFLLVFMPLLFGFGLRFKFMFPTKVYILSHIF